MAEKPFERTLANYFRERLTEVAEELSPNTHEDTVWYMGSMLARFGDTKQLFYYEQGQISIRPLALLYGDARETNDPRERCLFLRQLGDLALFLGALFPEKYARRGIQKDYFIGMGGSAYEYLSDNAPQNRHIFSELSNRFSRMLELIARVCEKQKVFDASDLLSLYERWRSTQDKRYEEQLRLLGVSIEEQHLAH